LDFPTSGNPTSENPTQLNKDISSKDKSNTDSINYSFLSYPFPLPPHLAGKRQSRRNGSERNRTHRDFQHIKPIITEGASGLSVCALLITHKHIQRKLSRARSAKFTLDSFLCMCYSPPAVMIQQIVYMCRLMLNTPILTNHLQLYHMRVNLACAHQFLRCSLFCNRAI